MRNSAHAVQPSKCCVLQIPVVQSPEALLHLHDRIQLQLSHQQSGALQVLGSPHAPLLRPQLMPDSVATERMFAVHLQGKHVSNDLLLMTTPVSGCVVTACFIQAVKAVSARDSLLLVVRLVLVNTFVHPGVHPHLSDDSVCTTFTFLVHWKNLVLSCLSLSTVLCNA